MSSDNLIEWITDSLVDPAVVVTEDLELLHANRAFLKLVGLLRRDFRNVVKEVCHELLDLETCDHQCPSKDAISRRLARRHDEVHARRSNLRLIVTSIPIFNADGSVNIILKI